MSGKHTRQAIARMRADEAQAALEDSRAALERTRRLMAGYPQPSPGELRQDIRDALRLEAP